MLLYPGGNCCQKRYRWSNLYTNIIQCFLKTPGLGRYLTANPVGNAEKVFSRHNHGGKPQEYNLDIISLINNGKYFISYGANVLFPTGYTQFIQIQKFIPLEIYPRIKQDRID